MNGSLVQTGRMKYVKTASAVHEQRVSAVRQHIANNPFELEIFKHNLQKECDANAPSETALNDKQICKFQAEVPLWS
tara:strand:+ start:920 stop:1150 length:231 start_codon:yes stop_codon:yes gene_type:complete